MAHLPSFQARPLLLTVITLAVFVSISFQAKSQGKIYTPVNCGRIITEGLQSIQQLYAENNRSGIDSVLNEWERQCGPSEYTFRMRALLKLEDQSFSPTDFDLIQYHALFGYLEDEKFKELMDSVHDDPTELYRMYFVKPELHLGFTTFTKNIAKKILAARQYEPCSTESMLLHAYSGHLKEFFQTLKDASCNKIPSNYYRAQVKSIERKLLVDASLYTGIWIPFGKNKLLGNHPLIGFTFGVGTKRMTFDLAGEFRFLKSKSVYQVEYDGVLTDTDHFFGGYFGLEANYELKRSLRSRWYFLTGIGTEGFDAIKSDPDNDKKGVSIFVFNANAGVGWRTFSRDGTFGGVELRHNFARYKNKSGTNLDGNSVTLRLMFGILKNDKRRRELNYFERVTRYSL
jgi:hypothetical protein